MATAPNALPQLDGNSIFLTDGGLETVMVFLEGVDLPLFSAFPLLLDETGRRRLENYFEPFLRTAVERKLGFVLDTPTWRCNPDWGAKLGYTLGQLSDINREAVSWANSLKNKFSTDATPVVVNGVIGPRGDGYKVETKMTANEARDYHNPQIESFRDAGAEMVSAVTMNYVEEAIGIAQAARANNIPSVISFTVETDGKLPSGVSLASAIEEVDDVTDRAPAYYMINCAHPTHFDHVFSKDAGSLKRLRGLRANASAKSHVELDEATELDPGDPKELAMQYVELRRRQPQLSILGGCCGTDHRHIMAICEACAP